MTGKNDGHSLSHVITARSANTTEKRPLLGGKTKSQPQAKRDRLNYNASLNVVVVNKAKRSRVLHGAGSIWDRKGPKNGTGLRAQSRSRLNKRLIWPDFWNGSIAVYGHWKTRQRIKLSSVQAQHFVFACSGLFCENTRLSNFIPPKIQPGRYFARLHHSQSDRPENKSVEFCSRRLV